MVKFSPSTVFSKVTLPPFFQRMTAVKTLAALPRL
jgi:hypothetical protein